jgi:hypothetical protein
LVNCHLIKKEDSGDVLARGNIEIPDYRLATTSDGKVTRLSPNIAPGALGFVIPGITKELLCLFGDSIWNQRNSRGYCRTVIMGFALCCDANK